MALGMSRILNAKSVGITEELVSSSQRLQCNVNWKTKASASLNILSS